MQYLINNSEFKPFIAEFKTAVRGYWNMTGKVSDNGSISVNSSHFIQG